MLKNRWRCAKFTSDSAAILRSMDVDKSPSGDPLSVTRTDVHGWLAAFKRQRAFRTVHLGFKRNVGRKVMDWKCHLLAESGIEILNLNGRYCMAYQNGREILLRWDGERWLVL